MLARQRATGALWPLSCLWASARQFLPHREGFSVYWGVCLSSETQLKSYPCEGSRGPHRHCGTLPLPGKLHPWHGTMHLGQPDHSGLSSLQIWDTIQDGVHLTHIGN
jgi:hypothetical protein